MPPLVDLSGKHFGRLVVLSRAPDAVQSNGRRDVTWNCVCDCGNSKRVRRADLQAGRTTSCGCLNREVVLALRTKHGNACSFDRTKHESAEYTSWRAMKGRCLDSKNIGFANYGGRGIKVCDRWRDSFKAFLADMGKRPPEMTLDRIDPNGNYEPSNCRWATRLEQRHNRRKKPIQSGDTRLVKDA